VGIASASSAGGRYIEAPADVMRFTSIRQGTVRHGSASVRLVVALCVLVMATGCLPFPTPGR